MRHALPDCCKSAAERNAAFESIPVGCVWGGVVLLINSSFFWWLTPTIAPLILSVPLSAWSSSSSAGEKCRKIGLFLTPEEITPHPEFSWLESYLKGYRPYCSPLAIEKDQGFVRAVVNPCVRSYNMKTMHTIPENLPGSVPGVSEFRRAGYFRWVLLTGALALVLVTPGAGIAEELTFEGFDFAAAPAFQAADFTAPPLEMPKAVPSWETQTKANRSYVLPALEIVGFEFLLNRIDYYFVDRDVYGVTSSTMSRNWNGRWIVDTDPFAMNQFLHPLSGSIYYGFARSSGLDFWESSGYTVVGSFLWEIAGETGLPSINDLYTTGLGGPFLGEPLFRMASLLLEGGDGSPGFWRELGAAAISPSLGFNRLVFGERFKAVFPSRNPAVFTRLQLGASRTGNVMTEGVSSSVKRDEATADFAMAYGLPGKPDYGYTRPFDYFNFQFIASTSNIFESIMSRGLLIGTDYAVGDSYRGVWGLYGSYDYMAPQVFRVSSTALSLGTTAQWWLSRSTALQGSALGGVGYGAAGTIHGSGERDYHYGATPQVLLTLRFLLGHVAGLEITGRQYYVSGVESTESRGYEHIFRNDAAFTVRVYGPHAVTLRYVQSHRAAHYTDIFDRTQRVATVYVAYTLLGDTNFGAVEWRGADSDGR